ASFFTLSKSPHLSGSRKENQGTAVLTNSSLSVYYDPDGRLAYAGRAGTGINTAELQRLWRRLQPLATDKMPLDVPPPRGSRFGSPLRIPASAQPGALGAAGTRRRGEVSHLDRRQSAAAGCV